ncbi:MAG: MBL fold metallo-hydrolase [Nanoarchaeota archaeon]|nr:MBL fold metallo-hydrolase [Nanoarchaeota archaeon]
MNNEDTKNINIILQWIGTGSGLNPTLGNTSFKVQNVSQQSPVLLVDCGYTVPLELLKQNQLRSITDIVITHLHADHMGGLESLGFMNYFAYKNRENKRPRLYLGSTVMAARLWNHSLKGGMENAQSDDNLPFNATLETYFDVRIGTCINIEGLPEIELIPSCHVQGLESYSVMIGKDVFYSGDSTDLPPIAPRLIFQDCQFYETPSDVHISYEKLKRELPAEIRRKLHLVHLGGGWEKKDPLADGFAGFVLPNQIFEYSSKKEQEGGK